MNINKIDIQSRILHSNRRFSAIVFYVPCTTFEKNEIKKFGILIFDVLHVFIRDLRILPEDENMSIQ